MQMNAFSSMCFSKVSPFSLSCFNIFSTYAFLHFHPTNPTMIFKILSLGEGGGGGEGKRFPNFLIQGYENEMGFSRNIVVQVHDFHQA